MATSHFSATWSGGAESTAWHYKSQSKLIDFSSRRSFNSQLLLARTFNLNPRPHRSHRRSVAVTNVIKDPIVEQGSLFSFSYFAAHQAMMFVLWFHNAWFFHICTSQKWTVMKMCESQCYLYEHNWPSSSNRTLPLRSFGELGLPIW